MSEQEELKNEESLDDETELKATLEKAEELELEEVEEVNAEKAEESQSESLNDAAVPYVPMTHHISVGKPRGGFRRFMSVVLVALIVGSASGFATSYFMLKVNEQQAKSTMPKIIKGDSEGNMAIADIADRVVPTVVGITNYRSGNNLFGNKEVKQSAGSGVIIREDGTLLTNFHVVAGASKLSVTLADGKNYEAGVVGYDQASDLAVLKIKGKNFPAIAIGDSSKLRVGDVAVAVGNPLGEEFSQTVTNGIISGINRKLELGNKEFTLIQTNCAINSGNSGGALVNGKGELIGINSVKIEAEGVEGLGFAIPINNVMSIVEQIEKEGTKERPYIGISGYSLSKELADQLHLDPTIKGLIVMQIVKGSPAELGGIKPGDIITAADGKEVTGFEELSKVLESKKTGEKLNLSIRRDQENIELQIVLSEQDGLNLPT